MIFFRAASFKKDYKNLSSRDRMAVDVTLELFKADPLNIKLENHPLSGKLKKHFSIKVGYDLRVIYRKEKDFIYIILVAVGKHNDVY